MTGPVHGRGGAPTPYRSSDVRPSRRRGGSSGGPTLQRPAAADPAALTLAHAAPDTELLAVGQRVLEAVLPDDAATADLFGLARGSTSLRKEQVGVDTHAVGLALPGRLFRSQQVEQVLPHRWASPHRRL